ncbi:MAG: ATP-binding cassette domain-containing protein [Rectinemataceae bacterium]|nr:ATP-binding cassette domain-containing protein [Rectinemataceae bacterium]
MTDNEILLEAKNLDISYGNLAVVFDVSFFIRKGEVVILVGRNGAGKTTLFRSIAGFLPKRNGTVLFKGENINTKEAYKIAQSGIKYIHQDKQVFSDLTIKENLELSSYASRDYDWEPVFSFFPKLKTLLARKAGALSGGERQMLLMGMSLLGKPDLLLLDEPTEGLAPHVITDLQQVFKEVSKTTTLCIIEQNLPLVAGIADRVYCMREGKIAAEITEHSDIAGLAFEKYL